MKKRARQNGKRAVHTARKKSVRAVPLDWQKAKKYKLDLSPEGWAWEFLRRNPKYVADWEKYSSLREKWGDFDDALRNCPTLDVWECEPPALPGESRAQWIARCGNGKMTSIVEAIASRWGMLVGPRDPRIVADRRTSLFFNMAGLSVRFRAGWWPAGNAFGNTLGESELAITFDLAKPILPQVERAKKYMRETQRWLREHKGLLVRVDVSKIPASKLAQYLQILDAREQRASRKTMVQTLLSRVSDAYPEYSARGRLSKAEKVAEALRDEGYRELTLMRHAKPVRKIKGT